MKNIVLKIIFILIICVCIIGVFFYTNNSEYKMQSFRGKFANEIVILKPIYKETTNFCFSQNFANRGENTACMEENIKNSSTENYNFFIEVQNFCENLTGNLADKWMCVDEITN